MTDQKIPMTTVTSFWKNLRVKKHDNEFRMTPKDLHPETINIIIPKI